MLIIVNLVHLETREMTYNQTPVSQMCHPDTRYKHIIRPVVGFLLKCAAHRNKQGSDPLALAGMWHLIVNVVLNKPE